KTSSIFFCLSRGYWRTPSRYCFRCCSKRVFRSGGDWAKEADAAVRAAADAIAINVRKAIANPDKRGRATERHKTVHATPGNVTVNNSAQKNSRHQEDVGCGLW